MLPSTAGWNMAGLNVPLPPTHSHTFAWMFSSYLSALQCFSKLSCPLVLGGFKPRETLVKEWTRRGQSRATFPSFTPVHSILMGQWFWPAVLCLCPAFWGKPLVLFSTNWHWLLNFNHIYCSLFSLVFSSEWTQ